MGKGLVIVGFLLSCALSVYYFQSIQNRNLKEKLAKAQNEPRVWFDAMQMFQYEKTEVKGYFSAGQAHFVEPNKVELYGRIQGYKLGKGGRELLSAETGEILLGQNGITQLMNGATVEKVQLENDVHVESAQIKLETPFAEYAKKTDKLSSNMPTKASGPNYVLESKNGFAYEIKSQNMQLLGPTKGIMQRIEGLKK